MSRKSQKPDKGRPHRGSADAAQAGSAAAAGGAVGPGAAPGAVPNGAAGGGAGAAAAGRPRLLSPLEVGVLSAIVFVGVLLRMFYLVELRASPDFEFPMADAAFKHYWAQTILTGREGAEAAPPGPEISKMPYVRPPLYPFYLAAVYLFTGTSFQAVRVLQMGIGLVNAVLMFFLGRALFGRATGLLAAGLMAVYWVFIFFEGVLTEVSITLFLILAIVLSMRSWLDRITPERVWAPGVLFGLLALARSETLLFLPVALAWGAWALRGRMPSAARWRTLALFAACVALTIAPVTLRNLVRAGEFVPICTIGGLNVYAGNNPEATGDFPVLDYGKMFGVSQTLSHDNFPALLEALRAKTGDETLGHSDLERHFLREALAYMAGHPGRTMALWARKLGLFWGPREVSSNEVQHFDRLESGVLRFLPGFPFAAAGGFFGLALWLWQRRRGAPGAAGSPETARTVALIALFVAVCCGTHLLFFVTGRFRVPVIPFLLLFASYGLVQLAGMGLAGRYAHLLRWGVAALALYGVFNVQWASYTPDEQRWRYLRGIAFGVTGRVDKAIAEFRAAVRPGDTPYWLSSELGYAYFTQAEYAEAERWYRESIAARSDDALTHLRLGDALMQGGRLPEAIDALREAIRLDFANDGARFQLASALSDLQRYDEALAQFDQLLARNAAYPGAQRRRGQVLEAQGRHDEAAAAFRLAIEQQPRDAEAHDALGFALASQGKVDEAVASYKTATDLEPGFDRAWTNLANAMAHLGRFDEATTYYNQAIHANPDSAAANYGWGFVLAQQGDAEGAVLRFREALRREPDYAEANNYLGFLLMGRGELPEAEQLLRRAIAADAKFALAHANLGELLRRTGRMAEAVQALETAAALDPADAALRGQAQALRAQFEQRQISVPEGTKVLQF